MMLMSRSLAVRGLWLLLCGGLTACGSLPLTQGSDPPELIPTRHFVADWNASGAYQISPDGQWLMWAARLGLGQGLFVKNLQTGQVQKYKIAAVGQWARDSRHILLHLQRNGDENAEFWALDVLPLRQNSCRPSFSADDPLKNGKDKCKEQDIPRNSKNRH
jgi:hypothetical protein